ncbi:protein kinase, partial [Gemmatimonas sp.]|uniref:protein kinase domain-containing protein n=1 Tax=Gemmatimonas sp. TaxID=1962908 RepID=UPI00286ACDD9
MAMSDLLVDLRAQLGDRYRIERELGGGGMSRVFVAEELALGRRVVLKVLPPDMAATVNTDRFRREVQFVARLQHPHIVPVLATGEDADTLWYSMPYVDGDTLRGRMSTGPMSVREAVTVWRDMLDALSYAHKAGVVHRDIKPDNVLLSGRHAVVTDFGIAKAVASATSTDGGSAALTGIGFVVGTPAYMAPEQAAGMTEIDPRADVYSTALVAYEMLTGNSPFGGMTPARALASQVQTMPASPRTLRADLPPTIDALLMRCLAKEVSDRPASADAVLEALDAIDTAGGVTTPASQPTGAGAAPGARPTSRGRGFAFLGVALAAGVATWLLMKGGSTRSAGVPVERDLLVVASFAHEAKDSSYARAVTEALRIDLQQSPKLRVAEPQLVASTLQTMRVAADADLTDSLARDLGRRTGAKAFVTGALRPLGSGYALSARLVSVADGSEVAALRETAKSSSDLLDAIDRLSKALREQAGESVASLKASPALPSVTTSSIEALVAYSAATEYMRNGEQFLGSQQYEKALQIDSTFASAWSGLSTTLSNMGVRRADRDRAVLRAFNLRSKLPPVERLKIESRYHSSRGEFTEEMAAHKALLAIEPTNYAALNNLGRLMIGRGRYAEAEPLLRAAIASRPGAVAPWEMLYDAALARGDAALVDSLRRTMSSVPSPRTPIVVANDRAVSAGEYTSVAKRLDSILATKPDIDIAGPVSSQRFRLQLMRGQLSAAERDITGLLEAMAAKVDPSALFEGEANIAEARIVALDDSVGARTRLAKLDAAIARSKTPLEDQKTLYRAFAHARAGNVAQARRLLASAEPLLPRDTTWRLWISGEIALAEGRPADAVRAFRRLVGAEMFCVICGSGALARSYDVLGQRDSVVAIYERMLASHDPENRWGEDVFERARALKRLGELYEERGNVAQAVRRYRDFVELWKDADPTLQPVVQDVRERIARLEQKRG